MICVSLGNISFDQCLELVQQEDLVEIRVDLLDLDKTQLAELIQKAKKVVITCREKEGYSEQDRINCLIAGIDAGSDYVDIEFEATTTFKEQVIAAAKSHKCDVIISYHNFEGTPEIDELQKIVHESFEMGADVAKLATMANDRTDNTKILSLYAEDIRLVAFCMGNLGKISRVLARYFRAEFTFAALSNEQATAPGQLTKAELVNMINQLNKL